MERLWSPWRMEYIRSAVGEHPQGCLFCDKLAAGDDEDSLILARSDLAFAILNAYPYNPGHLMVAPVRHVGELEELRPDELAAGSELLQRSGSGRRPNSARTRPAVSGTMGQAATPMASSEGRRRVNS